MRNLKKLLAVILSVVMIASMMVPALAANTYEAEALKLQAINVFAGGPEDLKLDEGVTRIQGLTFAIRAAGKDDDALAMEDEEVDTILADWTDADSIPQWGRKYAAYAIKNSITVGLSATEKIFGALNPISGTSFLVFIMKAGMGYADVTTADVIDAAVEAGILSAGQAIEFGQKEALIRDDAAGILYGAFTTGVNADGTKLIDAYIASGATTLEDAIEAGFAEEEVPEELEVVSVEANNLIQAVVIFNQPVDEETATDKDNYDFATADKITVDNAALSEDATTVTLTFTAKVDQQKEAKLTVSGVKTADGITMKKSTTEVYFLDNTIPEIVDAVVVGISTIKVTFSEPMNPDTVKAASFKVNDGKFYVKGVSPQKNNTEFLIELYTSLKDGDLPFEVKVGPADYAGFTSMGLITTLSVNEDKEAPVVIGYKDAKPHSIVLIWSEDIKLDKGDKANYYHTNGSNAIENNLTSDEIDGNEMTLTFKDTNKLPNGTAYVYVLKDSVKDYWNNKNAQQMVKVEVTVDEDAPVLEKIEVKAENKIVLTFDEDVKAATANKKSNYTLLDKDGKEVKNIFGSFEIDKKKVTINFTKKLAGGEYTLVLEDIEDLVGNAMNKTSESFTVTDKTAPLAKDFSAKLYVIGDGANADQIIKISFGEEMSIDGAYGINDLSKYVLNETPSVALEDIDDVTIEVVDGGKGVEITVPKGKYVIPASIIGKNNNGLKIGRVADAAGNYTAVFENVIDILPSGTVEIEKAELTGAKEIKVYFSDELAKFEAKEVKFNGNFANDAEIDNDEDISTVSTELKDGKTVAVYTFTEEFPYTADGLSVKTKAAPTGDEAEHETANSYGELLKYGANVPVNDKLAPALATIEVDDEDKDDVVVFERTSANVGTDNELHTSKIRLTFKEKLDSAYISKGMFKVAGFDIISVDFDKDEEDNDIENVIVIVVSDDSVHADVGTSITLRSPIADSKGNELTELDTTVSKVEGTVTVTGE